MTVGAEALQGQCFTGGQPGKASIGQLFQDGRLLNTLMLWLAFFCCLLMIYALSAWLPKLMNAAGYGLNSSLAFLLVLNFGAIFGAIGGSWLGDRIGLGRVLLGFFVGGALSLALLAVKSPLAVLYLLIGIAGACTIGTQILANACTVQYYPAHIRATGLGWAMGIGRIGAIIGPLLGGALHAAALPLQASFLAFAAPAWWAQWRSACSSGSARVAWRTASCRRHGRWAPARPEPGPARRVTRSRTARRGPARRPAARGSRGRCADRRGCRASPGDTHRPG